MLRVFDKNPLMFHKYRSFPPYETANAYNLEEISFDSTIRIILTPEIPQRDIVMSAHVICNVNIEDDDFLLLKARIAPHGNDNSAVQYLRSECSM